MAPKGCNRDTAPTLESLNEMKQSIVQKLNAYRNILRRMLGIHFNTFALKAFGMLWMACSYCRVQCYNFHNFCTIEAWRERSKWLSPNLLQALQVIQNNATFLRTLRKHLRRPGLSCRPMDSAKFQQSHYSLQSTAVTSLLLHRQLQTTSYSLR